MAALVVALQAVTAGAIFATSQVSSKQIESSGRFSKASMLLAGYEPPPDTGKPKDSSGAGGRS